MSESTKEINVTKSLVNKLAKIVGDIKPMQKEGINDFHKYTYFTESQMMMAVRGLLSKYNIFVTESTVSAEIREYTDDKQKHQFLAIVKTEHIFHDGDTGERLSVYSWGTGTDSGDKAVYKAITGSNKYALYKNFQLSDGQDPENDSIAPREAYSDPLPAKPKDVSIYDREGLKKAVEIERQHQAAIPKGHITANDGLLPGSMIDPKTIDWEITKIHFGKNKGKSLVELSDDAISWYFEEWTIKEFKGKYSTEDFMLNAALIAWSVANGPEGNFPEDKIPV